MASSPMIKPRPLKLKLNNAINPVRMSQMASKIRPMFRMSFMELILSIGCNERYLPVGEIGTLLQVEGESLANRGGWCRYLCSTL
jgi:hypothetical protein